MAHTLFGTPISNPEANLLPPPSLVDTGRAGASLDAKPRGFSSDSCAKGAAGERLLEAILAEHLPTTTRCLHDRSLPGTAANIDHIVIAPSGVWVIDSKNWSGSIECRDKSTWAGPRVELLQNGRPRTKHVDSVHQQALAVRMAIADIGLGAAPVDEVLCFVSMAIAPSGMPHRVRTALALAPTELVELLRAPGPLGDDAIQTIEHHLSTTFPAKIAPTSDVPRSDPQRLPSRVASPADRTKAGAMKTSTFSPDTRALIERIAAETPLLHTVSQKKPNRIVGVRNDGVLVETEASASSDNGTPLTPAWMIEVAWAHLRATGKLEQSYLLASDGLNVKRSAFVMALLARFPGVTVTLTPACLHYSPQGD